MARRRTTPKELPDAVRDAVERTVQATVGSAGRTRSRAQGAVDELVEAVRGAEAGLTDRLPATREDLKELKAELRRIGRRLDAIEDRLPRKQPAQRRSRSDRS
jgi:polyhydroxyalkanoate synthesis regulator phasin